MTVILLDNWRIEVVVENNRRRPRFIGRDQNNQRLSFDPNGFIEEHEIFLSPTGVFRLGRVNLGYSKLFPDAKNKLMKSLRHHVN